MPQKNGLDINIMNNGQLADLQFKKLFNLGVKRIQELAAPYQVKIEICHILSLHVVSDWATSTFLAKFDLWRILPFMIDTSIIFMGWIYTNKAQGACAILKLLNPGGAFP